MRKKGGAGWSMGSRRPHHSPQKIRPVLEELLCEFRRTHPDWGALKLLKALSTRHPEITDWPAASTTRRSARATGPRAETAPPQETAAPWCRPLHHGTERPVDCRIQGPVPDRDWAVLLSPHDRGPAHAGLAYLLRLALDGDVDGEADTPRATKLAGQQNQRNATSAKKVLTEDRAIDLATSGACAITLNA